MLLLALGSPSKIATAATRTIAYLRVSLEKQADLGMSLEVQRAKVDAYALLYNLDVIDVVVDAGLSAKSLNRPGLQRALAALRDGTAEALLVTKLDRLTRSVRDLGTLVDEYFAHGEIALMSVAEQVDTRSAAGRLVLNVLASVSQWEREAISERTSAVMQYKVEQGEYTGGHAPYGFAVGTEGALVHVTAEQHAIDRARELRASGGSFRAIAFELERLGFRSRAGKRFEAAQVRRMVGGLR